MLRKCRRCSEQVEADERICHNCGHDTVTGRPASSLRPPDPPPSDEPSTGNTTSVPTLIVALVIVLTFGFAGWRWFNAPVVAPVYAAAKAVERNLSLKRTVPQLSGSIERFSTAIAAVRDTDPSEGETEALDNHDQAVEVLNDSLKFWAARIEHGPALSPGIEDVTPLKDKYFLPVDDAGNIEGDESLQIIWLKAQESLDAGNQFYVPTTP